MTQTQQPSLPRAELFDVLPAMHEILARANKQQADTTAGDAGEADEQLYGDMAALETRDLPTEVLTVKAKIRRAQKELEKLPDMSRSIEEQEDEIRELEKRIQGKRNALKQLGEATKILIRQGKS